MIFWVFLAAVLVQCAYAGYFFARVARIPAFEPLKESDRLPVSIIICARNEAGNLRRNLPVILSQQYHDEAGKPNYEVIVVNDGSTDDTAQVLRDLEQRYDNLWDVPIAPDAERPLKGKKFALSKGAAHAANEWLVLIDADCMPAGNQWLRLMAAPLARGKEIVAGYGGYDAASGLLNAFTRWETMHTWLQYSTYTMARLPYMAVGRNLACTKQALLKAQASELWNQLPSGDDDLLVRIVANEQNMAIVADAAAFTHSPAKAAWGGWVKQKQRHLSTGKYYKDNIKMLLGGYAVAHAAVWVAFAALLFAGCTQLVLVIMAVRCCVYWAIWATAGARLGEKKLIWLFPFFDIGWLIYNFAFLPYITWKNKKQWT